MAVEHDRHASPLSEFGKKRPVRLWAASSSDWLDRSSNDSALDHPLDLPAGPDNLGGVGVQDDQISQLAHLDGA